MLELSLDNLKFVDQQQKLKEKIIENLHNAEAIYTIGKKIADHKEMSKDFKAVKVAVVSNGTCDELVYHITARLFLEQIRHSHYVSKYNELYHDVLSEESGLYQFSPQFILLLLDEKIITDKLPTPWKIGDFITACEDTQATVDALLSKLDTINAVKIIYSVVLSCSFLDQIIDYRSKAQVIAAVNKLNAALCNYATAKSNILYLDVNLFLQETHISLKDERLSFYAGMNLHNTLLNKIAQEFVKIVKAKLGLTKKVLVVDLDNTLWGGTVGDTGYQNIKVGGEYEGAAYKRFQKFIKQIANQGILLAINSKNNEKVVNEALAKNEEMVLRHNDFVSIKANWENKAQNILAIREELNLSLDSMVFVDDSKFECEAIRSMLPEVETIHLPEDPILYQNKLSNLGLFNKLEITEEDYNRTQSYLSENERKHFAKSFTSEIEFLTGLAIDLHFFVPKKHQFDRIAQLSMRTNQFNLTNLKLTAKEINEYMLHPDLRVIGVEYQDKFGSQGIISAIFLEHVFAENSKKILIKNILLSCRVFSRGVEYSILDWIVNYAKAHDVEEIIGYFKPTEKNQYANDFYIKNYFGYQKNGEFQYRLNNKNYSLIKKPLWVNVQQYVKG